ncbi:unnamed protein product [Penicillium nalgiovense]|uniref:Uncharacterized protein n=1 Tax=Penicillium nalgiovense TaxID=60175 RepID=A0A9W4HQI6_PENNA|nr:unnamed protein product [Penicillium nalgiovense]CAG8012078.1 unnamed protein product [Penicillium nalgiovense]CAG8026039.1 unnamed protein product [Penicillium nalgiovense]CAG8071860.1 unnamed protein product [Penicillium nalgiovense]CAG8079506.1 unnamed protein product [Penicillium nalgiovense]
MKAMFETLHREFSRLNIAVSNSDIEHFGDLSEVKGSDIDAVFAVNGVPRLAVYATSKAAV